MDEAVERAGDDELVEERFLVLAPTGRDGPLTASLLRDAGLRAVVCPDVASLCDEARRGAAALLIADEALDAAHTHRLSRVLADQPPWSDLPIIVFTGRAGTIRARPPTHDLLGPLGNVSLLERPVRASTMVSVARAALRARRRQYASRAALAREQRAVRERDQFLAMLGHELRNPLGVILLAADMLGSERDSEENRDRIRHQARHLSRLVDDLLDVARVTTGKIVLQRRPIDLNALIAQSARSVGAAIAAKRQHLRVEPAPTPVWVRGDPVRLEQVLVNLLTNASKYTPEGGHVTCGVTVSGDDAVLTVTDDGVGISDAMLSRVFDLFTQVEHTLDRAEGGLGIGLTLVRQLVDLHGGEVSVESAGASRGTRFTVRLPRDTTEALSDASAPAPRTRRAWRRVLVVDDSRDTRDLLQMVLETFGYEVHVAADGLEGVSQAVALEPDALVVDIGLPGLDGYGVARRIRETLGAEVLLIALTGYGQPEDKQRALEAGFDVHCTKPVDADRLHELLGSPG